MTDPAELRPAPPPEASPAETGAFETDAAEADAAEADAAEAGAAEADTLDSETRALDPAVQKLWAIKLALVALLFFFVALLYDAVGFLSREGHALPAGLLSGLVLALGGAWAVYWPRLRYRAWRFALREEELYLERGVLNRVRTVVPLRRIQHLDVSQDLLEREFSLGKLVVHTAGTRSADVMVPGLSYDEAERLRDEVKRYILALREDPL